MNDGKQFVRGKLITEKYGVSAGTLRAWADKKKVECVRTSEKGKRFYCVQDVCRALGRPIESDDTGNGGGGLVTKEKVCYARVSSSHQKTSLDSQVAVFQQNFPSHRIVTDVGSGLNWKRPGFTKILDSALGGTLEEVVVLHRDRLCRFAYELVEHVFHKTGVKLVVHSVRDREPSEQSAPAKRGFNELAEDLLAVSTFFTAQYHGQRSAEARRAKRAKRDAGQENSSVPDGPAEEDAQ